MKYVYVCLGDHIGACPLEGKECSVDYRGATLTVGFILDDEEA